MLSWKVPHKVDSKEAKVGMMLSRKIREESKDQFSMVFPRLVLLVVRLLLMMWLLVIPTQGLLKTL